MVHENGCWSEQMIRRLSEGIQIESVLRALDVIAERSPATVGFDEVCALVAVESTQLRAELGALSKTCRRLFDRKILPMEARQRWGDGTRVGYRMPEQVAQWWLNARMTTGDLEAR